MSARGRSPEAKRPRTARPRRSFARAPSAQTSRPRLAATRLPIVGRALAATKSPRAPRSSPPTRASAPDRRPAPGGRGAAVAEGSPRRRSRPPPRPSADARASPQRLLHAHSLGGDPRLRVRDVHGYVEQLPRAGSATHPARALRQRRRWLRPGDGDGPPDVLDVLAFDAPATRIQRRQHLRPFLA